MKRMLSTLGLICIFVFTAWAQEGILEKLQQIPQISDIQKLDVEPFEEYYRFWFMQPIDHQDPSKGTFKQQVLLGHRKADAPVVAELEGYRIFTEKENELTELFQANQVVIEHRFFDKSVPEGEIPWAYLTIWQAATDQHEIIQALRKALYPQSSWISTGISKGGQATIFHRYFYPQDTEISVPYVAPLNLAYVDPRLEKFLDKLGTNKKNLEAIFGGGSDRKECRWSIRDFQLFCFQHQEHLLPLLEAYAKEKQYTFQLAGGMLQALQLIILEYPFAFWQWGHSCEEIPETEVMDFPGAFQHLIRVSNPDFFEDQSIVRMYPFFYAALTETGMYNYNIKPFKKYLSTDKNIDFSFAFPPQAEYKSFNTSQMLEIQRWLQTDAEKILFVYGGNDPWYATSVDLKANDKCRKYVRGDMHHGCRIRDFDPISREDLMDTLKEWLKTAKNG